MTTISESLTVEGYYILEPVPPVELVEPAELPAEQVKPSKRWMGNRNFINR